MFDHPFEGALQAIAPGGVGTAAWRSVGRLQLVGIAKSEKVSQRGDGRDASVVQHVEKNGCVVDQVRDMGHLWLQVLDDSIEDIVELWLIVSLADTFNRKMLLVDRDYRKPIECIPNHGMRMARLTRRIRSDDSNIVTQITEAPRQIERVLLGPIEVGRKEGMNE
jgi:hypothetical protein